MPWNLPTPIFCGWGSCPFLLLLGWRGEGCTCSKEPGGGGGSARSLLLKKRIKFCLKKGEGGGQWLASYFHIYVDINLWTLDQESLFFWNHLCLILGLVLMECFHYENLPAALSDLYGCLFRFATWPEGQNSNQLKLSDQMNWFSELWMISMRLTSAELFVNFIPQ